MNRLIVISFATFFLLKVGAQSETNTKRIRPGLMWYYNGLKPVKFRKYDRFMIDVTYNTWSGDIKAFSNKPNSIGFNSSLMFDIPLVKENRMSIGVGITHNFFKAQTEKIINSTLGEFPVTSFNSTTSASINFLCGHSIAIPLELRIRTKGWRHIKFHLGGRAGYQLNVFSKVVISDSEGKMILKNHRFPDVNPLFVALHARIGIRNWALFASYNLNKVYQNDKSIQLNMIQIGLTVSLF